MSTVSYILPLKAPAPLPATGVTIVTFKVWKNTLISHLEQDANHHHFLPGGRYAVWTAAEFGRRIGSLVEDDPDKVTTDGKMNQLGVDGHRRELERILNSRNAQLSKFITHIATLCHHTENDDVTNNSTSLQWILDYLLKHYGLMTKGANFMNIADNVYKQGVPYQTFYKEYRASFVDNLRKQGDIVHYKNDFALTEDEKLSPSFESAIVLWALEKIDPRLPSKVKKNYGYQMTGNMTLRDIQPVVFENIDLMIEELDSAHANKAYSMQALEPNVEPVLNALRYQPRGNFRGARPPFSRGRSVARNRTQRNQPNTARNRFNAGDKFCRLCHLAGSDQKVYTSHEIGTCSRLTIRDLDSLRNSLLLNGIEALEVEENTDPIYTLQPGWDDAEAGYQIGADDDE